jgi:Na+-driven multidrug efflux pump
MRVFIADPAVVDAGVTMLRVVAFSLAFFGGLMVVQGGFRGAGDTRAAFVLSLLSRWVFRIPVAVGLAFLAGWGAVGLWWSLAAGSVASFVLGVAWFAGTTWDGTVVDAGADADDRAAGAPDDVTDAESSADD